MAAHDLTELLEVDSAVIVVINITNKLVPDNVGHCV